MTDSRSTGWLRVPRAWVLAGSLAGLIANYAQAANAQDLLEVAASVVLPADPACAAAPVVLIDATSGTFVYCTPQITKEGALKGLCLSHSLSLCDPPNTGEDDTALES